MQLKWKHQFQFAGYYQALEQGFYRDAGCLDVTIREGGPGIDAAESVAGGKADYGVCTSSVLRDWAAGRQLIVLAAIFQRSRPSSWSHAGLISATCRELRGRTLMDTPGSDEIAAMLKREGGRLSSPEARRSRGKPARSPGRPGRCHDRLQHQRAVRP